SVSTLFETPKQNSYISSPNPIAAIAVSKRLVPTSPFQNGTQSFDNGVRMWWSQATGARWLDGLMAQAWVPELGLAVSDKYTQNGSARMDFEHGYITWTPWIGVKVTFT
ncbi:LGFP repeat-containing protein, partial [Mycolicibacterium holsaticum]